jgi:hypothetical protein
LFLWNCDLASRCLFLLIKKKSGFGYKIFFKLEISIGGAFLRVIHLWNWDMYYFCLARFLVEWWEIFAEFNFWDGVRQILFFYIMFSRTVSRQLKMKQKKSGENFRQYDNMSSRNFRGGLEVKVVLKTLFFNLKLYTVW